MKILIFKLFVFKWQVGAWTIFKIAVHGLGGSYSGKFLRLRELCISLPLLCEGTPWIPMASTNRRAVFLSKWVHLWDAIIRICLNFRLQCRDIPVSFEQACVMAAMYLWQNEASRGLAYLAVLQIRFPCEKGPCCLHLVWLCSLEGYNGGWSKLFWKILVEFGVQPLILQNLASDLS